MKKGKLKTSNERLKYAKTYRENNKESIKKKMKKWREKNLEYKRKLDRLYYKNNKGECRKKMKEWNDKEYFGGNRLRVLERDNRCCLKCGMTQEQHIAIFGMSLHVHHIDGKGYFMKTNNKRNNDLDNLETLCIRCHSRKPKMKTMLRKSGLEDGLK